MTCSALVCVCTTQTADGGRRPAASRGTAASLDGGSHKTTAGAGMALVLVLTAISLA
jgi:hypothetical protein